MFNLIKKNHREFVKTNMCMCEILLLATIAKMYMTNTLIIANILPIAQVHHIATNMTQPF
jgi:hypothetical protein